MLTIKRLLRGARFMVFVSVAVVGCGGGDEGGGGGGEGDDDSGQGGSGDEGGAGGSSGSSGSSGTEAGGSSGSDTGGSGGKGGTSGGKGGTSGGKGGTSGTGTGATGPALDRIEAACEVDCAAQFALDCTPPNSNELICRANCAAQTGQLGDFCLSEYAALVECRGEGGYDCITSGTTTYPYQRSTCIAQQQALSMCTMDIGCKRSCDMSVDDGCTSMTLDECIEACHAEGEALPTDCAFRWDSVAGCKVTGGAECVDGELTVPAACASTVMYIAECVSDDTMDMCEGWCFAANALGCGGTDCATECADRLADATCGMAWTEVLDCGLFFNDAGCADGYLAANSICDSEMTTYTMCVGGGGM